MRLRLGSLASTAHSAQMPAQFYQHLSHRQHQPEPGTLPRAPQLHALPQHTRAVGPLLQPWPGPGPSSLCPGPVLCSPCPVTVTHLAFRRELQFSSMAGLTTAQLDHCLVGVRRTRAWSDRDTAWLTAGHLPRSPGFGPTTALVDHNLAASGPGHGWDTTQLGQQLAMGPCSSGPGQQSPAGHHANATNHTPDSVGGMITRAQSHTG